MVFVLDNGVGLAVHPATLTPMGASLDVCLKLLSMVHSLLRASGQAILLKNPTESEVDGTHMDEVLRCHDYESLLLLMLLMLFSWGATEARLSTAFKSFTPEILLPGLGKEKYSISFELHITIRQIYKR